MGKYKAVRNIVLCILYIIRLLLQVGYNTQCMILRNKKKSLNLYFNVVLLFNERMGKRVENLKIQLAIVAEAIEVTVDETVAVTA